MLQSALEEGFAAIGRGLHGENNAIEKAKAVTWTSAAASCLPFVECAGPLLLALVKVCPNCIVAGKKLDAALMACHKTKSITSESRFELVDAERASEKIRQILGKIRKLKDGKERLNVMKVAIGFALNSLYVLSEVIRECKLIVSERYFLRDVRDYDLMTSL